MVTSMQSYFFSEVLANAHVKICLRHSEVLCSAQSEVKCATHARRHFTAKQLYHASASLIVPKAHLVRKRPHLSGRQMWSFSWRRWRDSNSRRLFRPLPHFECGPFNHLGTSPNIAHPVLYHRRGERSRVKWELWGKTFENQPFSSLSIRMMVCATWALVAVPWGERRSFPVPRIKPVSNPQFMAGRA